MRALRVAFAAGVIALGFAVDAKPAAAYIVYPWCAHYLGRMGGAPSCGFVTWEQCMATVSGMQGTCAMNPFYEGPPPPAQRVRKKPRSPG